MAAVGLVGFAGVVVSGLLYIVFLLRGASLKLPSIGMVVFALMIAAAVLLPRLESTLLEFLAIGGWPSRTEQVEHPAEDESQAPEAGGFLRQVLLNKRGLVITATGLDENGGQGPALKVTVQNRSETDVFIQVHDASVNGYMIDCSFSAAVTAGQEAKMSILFPASEIQKSDVGTIAELELFFRILDRNRIAFLESGAVTVRTPAADTYRPGPGGPGEELYNENGVRIISKGFAEKGSAFGQGLVLLIENGSGRAITLQAGDVTVNGLAADAVFSGDVLAGKRLVAAVTVTDASFQDGGVGEIRDMSFRVHVLDRERRTVLFDTGTLTAGTG